MFKTYNNSNGDNNEEEKRRTRGRIGERPVNCNRNKGGVEQVLNLLTSWMLNKFPTNPHLKDSDW